MGTTLSSLIVFWPRPEQNPENNLESVCNGEYGVPADISRTYIKTANGSTITGILISRKNKKCGVNCKGYTIVYSHGNGYDLHNMSCIRLHRFSEIFEESDVFFYDYSGYGSSTGHPSQGNIYADADAVYNYLVNEKGIPWTKIILYGESLGSASATFTAHKYPVRGVFYDGGFATLHRALLKSFSLPGDILRNIFMMPKVHAPVFVIHSKFDSIVNFANAQQMSEASADQPIGPLFIDDEKIDHMDASTSELYSPYISAALNYLSTHEISEDLKRQAEQSSILPIEDPFFKDHFDWEGMVALLVIISLTSYVVRWICCRKKANRRNGQLIPTSSDYQHHVVSTANL